MDAAPLYADVADGPEGGQAHWIRAADGVRLRVGHWADRDAKGTVIQFTGRTEYIEKYGRTARELQASGFATLVLDWRGQGLSDRLHSDPGMGHVGAFADYQHDVAAAFDHARALGLPEPYYLIAHSMGGAIGLRAMMNGLPIKAAVFSAPMWGISLSRLLRPYAWTIATLGHLLGQSHRVTPGQSTKSYQTRIPLAESELTHDAEMLDYMQDQVATYPALGLGGPSIGWVRMTLIETRALAQMTSPSTPALTLLGGLETIVDPARIHARMDKWSNGALTVIPTGKHEMMLETPDIRTQVYQEITTLFNAHP